MVGWFIYAGLNLRRNVTLLLILIVLSPGFRISPGLPVIFADDILLIVVSGLFITAQVTGERASVSKGLLTPTGLLLVLFLPVTAISMIIGYLGFDIAPTKGGIFEFVKLSKYILAFYIASQVRLNFGHIKAIAVGLVIVISMSAGLGLAQAFDLFGAREFSSNVYFAIARDPISGELSENMLSAINTRAAGTVGNPNAFGILVGVGLILAVVLLLSRAFKKLGLVLLLSASSIMVVSIVISGSRTAIFGVLIAVIYLLLWGGYSTQKRAVINFLSKRRMSGVQLAIVAIFLGLFGLVVLQQISGTQETIATRIARISNFDIQQTPIQARLDIIDRGIDLSKESPILGFGPAEGRVDMLHHLSLDSEPIFVLLRYGIVGVILYVFFWISAFRLGRSLLRINHIEAKIFGHFVGGLVILNVVTAIAASSFFDIRRMTLTCILLGLCVACKSAFSHMGTANEETSERPNALG